MMKKRENAVHVNGARRQAARWVYQLRHRCRVPSCIGISLLLVLLTGCSTYRVQVFDDTAYLVPPGQKLGLDCTLFSRDQVVYRVPVSEFLRQDTFLKRQKIPFLISTNLSSVGEVHVALKVTTTSPQSSRQNAGRLLISVPRLGVTNFLNAAGIKATTPGGGDVVLGGSAGLFEQIRMALETNVFRTRHETNAVVALFSSTNAMADAVHKARGSIPWPATRILEHTYNFSRQGKRVLLVPGMTLRLEHTPLFKTTGRDEIGMSAGPSEVRVLRDADSKIFFENFVSGTRFERDETREKKGTIIDLHRKPSERMKHYALWIPSSFPKNRNPSFSNDRKRFLVVGADQLAHLYFWPETLDSNPARNLTTYTGFSGRTSVAVLIPVYLDGDRYLLPVGTSLRDVLAERLSSDSYFRPGDLKVQRLYGGRYHAVRFSQALSSRPEEMLSLPVLAGDKLTLREDD